jgi:hypothetical protein
MTHPQDTADTGLVEETHQLLEEIGALLASGSDDVERLERTLTDGYAWALSLDGERRRLHRSIEALALGGGRREGVELARRLEQCECDLNVLRDQLRRLQPVHSTAVRRSRAYTSPDLTA